MLEPISYLFFFALIFVCLSDANRHSIDIWALIEGGSGCMHFTDAFQATHCEDICSKTTAENKQSTEGFRAVYKEMGWASLAIPSSKSGNEISYGFPRMQQGSYDVLTGPIQLLNPEGRDHEPLFCNLHASYESSAIRNAKGTYSAYADEELTLFAVSSNSDTKLTV